MLPTVPFIAIILQINVSMWIMKELADPPIYGQEPITKMINVIIQDIYTQGLLPRYIVKPRIWIHTEALQDVFWIKFQRIKFVIFCVRCEAFS